jgi:4-hydroxy 2-oxovalerate aldolase
VAELGFRFLKNEGFKGPTAFTTDEFLQRLSIPPGLTIGVMVNGSDLCTDIGWQAAIECLFPKPSSSSPVDLVRLACHFEELANAFSAASWLMERGYRVGVNLMQIADRSKEEVEKLGKLASISGIEVLYFADSMGSMTPDDTSRIIGWLRTQWWARWEFTRMIICA